MSRDSRCDHVYPVVVDPVEGGGWRAHCLLCGTAGPVGAGSSLRNGAPPEVNRHPVSRPYSDYADDRPGRSPEDGGKPRDQQGSPQRTTPAREASRTRQRKETV